MVFCLMSSLLSVYDGGRWVWGGGDIERVEMGWGWDGSVRYLSLVIPLDIGRFILGWRISYVCKHMASKVNREDKH